MSVSVELMAVVLFGAVLHAVWNALVRAASDKFLSAVLVVGGCYWRPLQTIVAFSVVGAAFNSLLILFIWRLLKPGRPSQEPRRADDQFRGGITLP